MPHLRAPIAFLAGVLLVLTGCTASPADTSSTTPPHPRSGPHADTVLPDADTVVVPGADAAELAVATSRVLYAHAPAVVLVAADDDTAIQRATTVAVDLGVPLLVTPGAAGPDSALRAELVRLDPDTLVAVGDRAASWARDPAAREVRPRACPRSRH